MAMRRAKGFSQPTVKVLNRLLDEHRFLLTDLGYDLGQLVQSNAATKRAAWKRVKAEYHPPVSKLTVRDLIGQIFATNKHLGYNYDRQLQEYVQKKVITKRCKASMPPDGRSDAPAMALPKSKDPDDDLALPRKLSAYQQHMQSTLAELKSSDMSAKERFTEAVRLWNRSKNIKKTQASIERGRQARKRRAANPLPASEPIEFQTAPRKRTAAATPRRSSAPSRIGKLQSLTASQKKQVDEYSPRRNKDKLKRAVRMHLMRGLSFNEARKRAENPIGSQVDAADSNLDLIAGSGAKKKLNFRVDGPSLTMI
eukprot:COSAG01_NODE_4795_length_4739_cov_16.309267_2_plen_311_part_00